MTRFRARFSRPAALLGTAATLCALTGTAHAQIQGNYAYDPAFRAYFVHGNTTVNGDLTGADHNGNDVFVGKDNEANWNTLNGPFTLTVNGDRPNGSGVNGAKIFLNDKTRKNGVPYQGLHVFGANTANVNGGQVPYVTGHDNSVLNLRGGGVGNAFAYDNTKLTISGTDPLAGLSQAIAYDNSTMTISGGSVHSAGASGSVGNASHAKVFVTGGRADLLGTSGFSQVTVSGGSVGGAYNYGDDSVLTILGGDIAGVDTRSNNGLLPNTTTTYIKGGTIGQVTSAQRGTTNISSGYVKTLDGYNVSHVNISGGVVDTVTGYNNSVFDISGGTFCDVIAKDQSVFNITGGHFPPCTIYQGGDLASVNFFGRSLVFSSAVAGVDAENKAGVFYDAAWTRPDGFVVNTRYFDINGNISAPTPQGTTFTFSTVTAAAPEPGTFALLGVGCWAFGVGAARRRKA